jgi:hypothetical protein
MTFKDAYGYADLVFSQRFEGNEQVVDWTDEDLLEVDKTQKYGLIRPVPDELRQLYTTKILRAPLAQMASILESGYTNQTKYMLYSGHDQQIANMLDFLLPDFKFDGIKYASVITMELRVDHRCIGNGFYKPSCYKVRMNYNGNYINLLDATIYADSAISEYPGSDIDATPESIQVELDLYKYDITY